MRSIRSIYKIGNGPSSSHTVGPYRAAQLFRARCPGADAYRVTLYGSLAFTGEGHGTKKAILCGLPGAEELFYPKTDLFRAADRTGGTCDEKHQEHLQDQKSCGRAGDAGRNRMTIKKGRSRNRTVLPSVRQPFSGLRLR